MCPCKTAIEARDSNFEGEIVEYYEIFDQIRCCNKEKIRRKNAFITCDIDSSEML